MKKQVNSVYKKLQKNRRRITFRAVLMCGLLLAINTLAWFAFMASGETELSADVIAWDISFLVDGEQVEELELELDDLYPGMDDVNKSVVVTNQSDLDATFSYEVEELIAYGVSYTSSDMITSLENDFPFSITFDYSGTTLLSGDSITFSVNVSWPFESSNDYYRLNALYEYNSEYNYYVLSSGEYVLTTVEEDDYDTLLGSGLYVESDDADTYWGEKSAEYDDTDVILKVKLIVTQTE